MTSKVNDNSDASDYTWASKVGHTVRAGRHEDGFDVCYIEDADSERDTEVECYTPEQAIALATDLLGWAQFVREGVGERELEDAVDAVLEDEGNDPYNRRLLKMENIHKDCSLLKRQAD